MISRFWADTRANDGLPSGIHALCDFQDLLTGFILAEHGLCNSPPPSAVRINTGVPEINESGSGFTDLLFGVGNGQLALRDLFK